MTAALSEPARREWTVDDLAGLPPDLPYELINGRLIAPSVYAVTEPWPITIDLPKLSARRAAILKRAEESAATP